MINLVNYNSKNNNKNLVKLSRYGPLYIEINKYIWEEMLCMIENGNFQLFKKLKPNLPATIKNKSELFLEVIELYF